jgi:hypothetical protein
MLDLIKKRKFDLLSPLNIKGLLYESDIIIIQSDKKLYSDFVRWLSEYSYNILQNQLDTNKKRSKQFHMDHKYSISNGYENNINPFIIAHPSNLEIITKKKNLKKSSKNSIEISLLIKEIQLFGEIFY